jgi:hypothetical protein
MVLVNQYAKHLALGYILLPLGLREVISLYLFYGREASVV